MQDLHAPHLNTKRSFFFRGWFLIPTLLLVVGVLFATKTIDPVFSFIQNTFSEISHIAKQIKGNSSYENLKFKDSRDYLAGVPIQDILNGYAKYVVDETAQIPNVDALAFVVGDVLSGEILLEKNADQVLPIASLTKLMTASVALEELKETDFTKVSQRATLTESSRGMLRANESIGISDLLYPLLLVSSNDSAEVIAESKGRKNFIQAMNKKATSLAMTNTSFDDPSGLSEHNTSTARDLFTLSNYLYNHHQNVFEISKLKEYTQGGRTWKNANRLTDQDIYEGGKTGYTSKAHRTGVALFRVPFEGYGERVIAITLLKTDNRAEDYNALLSFVREYVNYNISRQTLESGTESISLAFVGDIMLDRGVKSSVVKNFGGDYSKLFDNLRELKNADIAFANLEGPISSQGTNVGSKYSFRFEPIVAQVLKNAGIDVVSFANNHVGDWSLTAFVDTLRHLQEAGMVFAGAGETKNQASQVKIIESKGIKVGFLGFSDVGPTWIEAKEGSAGQLLASDPERLAYIKTAKEKVDVLVVSYHWGDEYVPHTTRQTMLGQTSIDAGADIVVGHHPHIVQDTEEYNGGLIAYSLGNAIFDQHFSKETMQGGLLSVNVDKNGLQNYKLLSFDLNSKYQPQKPTDPTKKTADKDLCPTSNDTFTNDPILFNISTHAGLSKNFVPKNLVAIPQDIINTRGRTLCLQKDTLEAFKKLYEDAKKDGIEIVPTSGFRSSTTQEQIFSNWQKNNPTAQYFAIAKPGHSEHQLGTTLDLTSQEIEYRSATQLFENTKAYNWLVEHGSNYGFVQSYQEGTENITGYIPESWHWRYVGVEHAQVIRERNVTPMEYLIEPIVIDR